MASALRWGSVRETFLGYSVIALTSDGRIAGQLPLHFCPWCQTEVSDPKTRPPAIIYPR